MRITSVHVISYLYIYIQYINIHLKFRTESRRSHGVVSSHVYVPAVLSSKANPRIKAFPPRLCKPAHDAIFGTFGRLSWLKFDLIRLDHLCNKVTFYFDLRTNDSNVQFCIVLRSLQPTFKTTASLTRF